MTTPFWVQDAIFYQIFPDRFANGDSTNDPPNVQKWGEKPTVWHFQGGDLRGIIQKMDYLLDLGINAIYLNPIFHSPSPHRYNTIDYYKIDPKLGTITDFHDLIDTLHRNNFRIIIDGVFNHCGRGFFAFNDVLENGENSSYKDWFLINKFPLDAFTPGEAENYQAWWKYKALPKFNTRNPAVRDYIFNVVRYWSQQGIDGWRLDVPNEIDDDTFWEEFRYTVKTINRDAYLLGEIWTVDPRWVNETHFDGLINYPLRDDLLRLLYAGTLDTVTFAEKVESLLDQYPRENVNSMYVPLGSHDTERLWSKLGGDINKVKLAFLFQFAYPGAPAIYYGDEVGLEGDKDPDCRRAFPWDSTIWKGDLRLWVKSLIAARKRLPTLRRGDYQRLLAVDDDRGIFAFARIMGEEKIIIAINVSHAEREFQIPVDVLGLPDGRNLCGIFDNKQYKVSERTLSLTLPPLSGTWIG